MQEPQHCASWGSAFGSDTGMQSDSFPAQMIHCYPDGFAPAVLVWGRMQVEVTQVSAVGVFL